jgi:IstB-like ATP binding protein
MIDRLVHHAEILALKGDSYRLRDKDLGSPAPSASSATRSRRWSVCVPAAG